MFICHNNIKKTLSWANGGSVYKCVSVEMLAFLSVFKLEINLGLFLHITGNNHTLTMELQDIMQFKDDEFPQKKEIKIKT